MGSNFFKASSPKIGGPGNSDFRVLNSGSYAARFAGGGAQKDLGAALAINKSKFKSQKTNGAYAKGPKV